ncbi:CBS domain-containing protein [Segetibacter sp. 3557_3]|uniref:CBS domain-containing protein n=1 Tax=Segetibacter sp. 3557_3 TaxID=2547429 RepID=UPI001058E6D1|nr:CBS domain-containing protein [Segetibacter sp. 3557_3]TDH23098.1 CBS domain-containing protein [Segetibacter sp. 3557_3]
MLSSQLVNTSYPTLDLFDKVSSALQFMEDFDIEHLPVQSEDRYLGLITKDDLLDTNENAILQILEEDFIKKAVKPGEHFLSALKIAAASALTLVPVVTETGDWLGGIPAPELLKMAAAFTGSDEPGAVIVLEMEKTNYSLGEISRLVETNDAFITQCNTLTEPETGLLIVTLRLNKLLVSNVIATFQRYEYSIRYFMGEEEYENELRYNYEHLMSYLKV